MFDVDGAFVTIPPELPDFFTQNSTKICYKGKENLR